MSASKVDFGISMAGASAGISQPAIWRIVEVSSELPKFRKVRRGYAAALVHDALSGPHGSSLLQLVEFDDHHFRVVFNIKQFQLAEGKRLPSKSQWNSLKKRLKRRDRSIFIFRRYGSIDCAEQRKALAAQTCLYLDFGFLVY